MRAAPPRKPKDKPTGPRRFDGALRDVAHQAAELGVTEKALRAQVARGVIPHQRLGSRVVFLADEVSAYLRCLPGVSIDEALSNIAARGGKTTATVSCRSSNRGAGGVTA